MPPICLDTIGAHKGQRISPKYCKKHFCNNVTRPRRNGCKIVTKSRRNGNGHLMKHCKVHSSHKRDRVDDNVGGLQPGEGPKGSLGAEAYDASISPGHQKGLRAIPARRPNRAAKTCKVTQNMLHELHTSQHLAAGLLHLIVLHLHPSRHQLP